MERKAELRVHTIRVLICGTSILRIEPCFLRYDSAVHTLGLLLDVDAEWVRFDRKAEWRERWKDAHTTLLFYWDRIVEAPAATVTTDSRFTWCTR